MRERIASFRRGLRQNRAIQYEGLASQETEAWMPERLTKIWNDPRKQTKRMGAKFLEIKTTGIGET